MKNFYKILCLIVLVALSGVACQTLDRMLDQTYFNADKNVWSYEEFKRQNATYEQYSKRILEAEDRLREEKLLEEKADKNLIKQLNQEIQGSKNMKRDIASRYNAMSETAYQSIWKSNNLPERLGED